MLNAVNTYFVLNDALVCQGCSSPSEISPPQYLWCTVYYQSPVAAEDLSHYCTCCRIRKQRYMHSHFTFGCGSKSATDDKYMY